MKKSAKGEYNSTYFLIKDILSCFPYKVGDNLVNILNQHFIVKEKTRQILKEEIVKKNPKFQIIMGALILQNDFLRQTPQIAFYEVIEIVNELKYCFYKDKRKTIRSLSAQIILRLFATLYLEFRLLPSSNKSNEGYLDQFIKSFSKQDILDIFYTNGFEGRLIFQSHGIDLGSLNEINTKLTTILHKFY